MSGIRHVMTWRAGATHVTSSAEPTVQPQLQASRP